MKELWSAPGAERHEGEFRRRGAVHERKGAPCGTPFEKRNPEYRQVRSLRGLCRLLPDRGPIHGPEDIENHLRPGTLQRLRVLRDGMSRQGHGD